MNIAVIADTHDRLPFIEKTVDMINGIGIDLVIHCGDYSAPFAVNPYQRLKAPLKGVYGNNDAERNLLGERVKKMRNEIVGNFAYLTVGGLKLAVTHGDDEALLDALVMSKGVDILLHGHTHKVKLERVGGVLILNPGEVCGYLTGESTFATIDLETREVKTITID